MKTKLLFVLFMISDFTGFTQIIPIFHKGWEGYEWKEYQHRVDFRNHKFDSIVNFKNAHFDSKLRFFGAEFHSLANFENTQFDSTANFEKAHFDSSAKFIDAKFISSIIFDSAEFHSLANFKFAQFDSTADFLHAQFDSTADFYVTKFNSVALFGFIKFHSSANFNRSIFNSTFFGGTKFNSNANFDLATFLSNVDFGGAEFDSIASFRYVLVKDSIVFDYNTLPLYLDLSGIQLKGGDLDLTNSIINKKYGKCLINLVNADIEKIKLRYSTFELYFPDKENINSDIKTNTYERLLKNQKDNGFTSSYEKLDKEYAAFKYLKSGKYSSLGGWTLNMVNKYWWGYGYDKTLIIVNTLLIFVLFSLVNCIFFPWILNIYEVPNIKSLAAAVTAKNVVLQRIKIVPIAFFYTGLIFFGLKFSTENLKYKENLMGWRVFNLVYFFVIYISGIVCLGYLANFILST